MVSVLFIVSDWFLKTPSVVLERRTMRVEVFIKAAETTKFHLRETNSADLHDVKTGVLGQS